MVPATSQVARLPALVPYLQARPGVPIAEVAEAFGVTARQVLGHLNVLCVCGVPGGVPDVLIEIDMHAGDAAGRGDRAARLSPAPRLQWAGPGAVGGEDRQQPAGRYIDSQRGNKAFAYADGMVFLSKDNGRTWPRSLAFSDAQRITFSHILKNGNIL